MIWKHLCFFFFSKRLTLILSSFLYGKKWGASSMCCNIFNCQNRIQNIFSYDVIGSVRTQNVIFDMIQVLVSVLIYIFDLIGSSIYCARLHTVRTPNVFFDLISYSMCCNIFNCQNRIQNMLSLDVIGSVKTMVYLNINRGNLSISENHSAGK